jgi:RNA-directed DNA polymerase
VKFHRPTQPFGPHRLRKDGHVYLGASPSKKSVSRLRQKVADLLVRQNVAPWTDVRDRLNRSCEGGRTTLVTGPG